MSKTKGRAKRCILICNCNDADESSRVFVAIYIMLVYTCRVYVVYTYRVSVCVRVCIYIKIYTSKRNGIVAYGEIESCCSGAACIS